MPPRRGRPPAAEPKLDGWTIVDAALETLQEEGLDRLTMSRVAARIGVQPASLYWHVRNKEELIDQLAEAVMGRQDLTGLLDPDDWRGSVAAMMHALRGHLLGYRDSARLLVGRFSTRTGQLLNIEVVLAALRSGGLADRDAAYALFLLSTFVLGSVSGEQAPLSASVLARRSPRMYLDDLRADLAGLPVEVFPHTRSLAAELTEPDLATRFEFGLGCVLDGIAALPRHPAAGPR
ncbi:TetR/AcrR family transcriptional regulator C-terminal domain-containing protein [Pseudonocardia sp. GCM10023141]|uniref:TetR/AcrR family transcriptional regulator C-terminal domain-containing protein n=1 Tax=Pseudonocardia sp. GCM10023141 TaxID=3252653 RepID=UPI003617BA1D